MKEDDCRSEEQPVRKGWRLTEMEEQINVMERIKIKRILICPPSFMFDPPPQRRNHLTVSDSLPLHPGPLYFPVWECSCAAAAAILNYIGQWEIVCMLQCFFLAGLATEAVKLASVHRLDAANTLRHSVTSSCASEEERTKDYHDANQQTHMHTGTGRENQDFHTVLREQ